MNKYFIDRDKCPACYGKEIVEIISLPFISSDVKKYLEKFYKERGSIDLNYLSGSNFSLVECIKCGLIYQKEVLNGSLMKILYEKWIDPEISLNKRKKSQNLTTYINYAREIMSLSALINKYSNEKYPLTILDFGLDWGEWALMAKAFGHEVFGCEISEPRISNAVKNGITILKYEELEKIKFDFINTEQVFEHIDEPLKTLKYLKKCIKKGGIIKISVPSANNIKKILIKMDWEATKGSKYSLNPISPLEHINCFTRKSLEVLGQSAELKEIKLPLHIQYSYSTNWSSKENIVKNIIYPFYLNYSKKRNYILFVRE